MREAASARFPPRRDRAAAHFDPNCAAPPGDPARRGGPGILSVVRRIWLPGLGAALSSVGFGAIAAFSSLLFADHGWTPVWLAFSAYALSLIIARLAFGHLPDRIGGARVALMFVVVEVIGLVLMSFASTGIIAAIGAALTGLGYSLVFPRSASRPCASRHLKAVASPWALIRPASISPSACQAQCWA